MAVYTSITKKDLSSLLNDYGIGDLINFEGILEGVENTNYKFITSKKKFILTIFEKRVRENELPFFIELQNHITKKNIRCPEPIANKNGQYINTIKNKRCVIMSFLEGKKLEIASPKHCYEVGIQLARMHYSLRDFPMLRKNNLDQSQWRKIFDKCKLAKNFNDDSLIHTVNIELSFLDENWPKSKWVDIPKGIIHADLFRDNVFFNGDIFAGIIDFYFACVDFYIYDLSICINDWCFDKIDTDGKFDKTSIPKFNKDKFKSIIKGYQKFHILTKDEIKYFNIILRGASIRFFLTRLYDKLFHHEESFVEPKNPLDYFYILEFHQKNDLVSRYFSF